MGGLSYATEQTAISIAGEMIAMFLAVILTTAFIKIIYLKFNKKIDPNLIIYINIITAIVCVIVFCIFMPLARSLVDALGEAYDFDPNDFERPWLPWTIAACCTFILVLALTYAATLIEVHYLKKAYPGRDKEIFRFSLRMNAVTYLIVILLWIFAIVVPIHIAKSSDHEPVIVPVSIPTQ